MEKTYSRSVLATVACTAVSFTRYPTEFNVHQVCGDNGNDAGDQEPYLLFVKELFEEEHQYSEGENNYRAFRVMMSFEAVSERIKADTGGQGDHEVFEYEVIDQVIAEKRQAGQHQG